MASLPNETRCVTYMETEECSLLWTIQDFSWSNDAMKVMESAVFCSTSQPKTQWTLRMNGVSDNIMFNLCLKERSSSKTHVNYYLCLIDIHNQERRERDFDKTFTSESSGDFYSIPKNDLLQYKELFPNKNLTVLCKVRVYLKQNVKLIPAFDPDEVKDETGPNLLSALTTPFFSDVTLVVEGNEIVAHKVVLSTHSDVFLAMFRSDMVEKDNNKVEIDDLTFDAVSNLVRFMYGGKVPSFGEKSKELLKAADKYNVKGLVQVIEKQMILKTDMSNACDLLLMAHIYNLTRAKRFLKKFILDQPFEECKKIVGINKLHSIPNLFLEPL